ncbi:MAG TPA: hypothetical protein PLF40_04145 [Kofleriaceae bacterium]|nr:hypothetical protein [Kofleriaceae bacterium]
MTTATRFIAASVALLGCASAKQSQPVGGPVAKRELSLEYVDETPVPSPDKPFKLAPCEVRGRQLASDVEVERFIAARVPRINERLVIKWLTSADSKNEKHHQNGPDVLNIDLRDGIGRAFFSNGAFQIYCLRWKDANHLQVSLIATVVS